MPAAFPFLLIPLVLAFFLSAPCSQAAEATLPSGHFYVDAGPGQLLEPSRLQAELRAGGSELRVQSLQALDPGLEWSGRCDLSGLHRLVLEDAQLPPEAACLDLLRKLPSLKRVEAVQWREVHGWHPDDPGLTAQWHLRNVAAVEAWQIQRGRDSVSVAILDTGVDMDHEDLAGRIWIHPGEDLNGNGVYDPEDEDGLDTDGNGLIDDIQGWDYVDLPPGSLWQGEDGSPADNWPDDFNGHGTHCAGIAAAAGDNGMGVAGLGFGARVMAIRVGYQSNNGQAYVGYSIEGLMLAAYYGADVVSMSYGGSGFSDFVDELTWNMSQGGVVCLASAGNDGITDTFYPAGYENVISVAATNPDDSRAGYSNYGDWIDLGAPGTQILATLVGGGYGRLTGTSMSCPLTAGLCALLKGVRPEWGITEVRARLQASCDPVSGNPEGMGAGRINAARAVDLVPRVSRVEITDPRRRLADGEWSEVAFTVYVPLEDPLAEAVIQLESLEQGLEFESPSVDVGMLFPQQETTVTTRARWTGEGVASPLFRMVLYDNGPRWEGLGRLEAGLGEVLLIDADRATDWDIRPWITESLDALGLSHESISMRLPGMGWPMLSRYDHILLLSGSDLEPDLEAAPLPPSLFDSLEAYRAGGGHLLLSGQNLADALPANWLADELGAAVADPAVGAAVAHGIAGDPLTEGLQLLLIGSGGAGNQEEMDQFFAPDARVLFSWDEGDPSAAAALRSEDGRLTVLGFGLEGVNGEPDWASSRSLLLERLLGLETALGRTPLPAEFALQAAWPNPFNPELQLALQLDRSRDVVIEVYNLAGARVDRLAPGRLSAGRHQLSWRPQGLASGHYLMHLRDSRHSPTSVLYLK